MPRRIVLDSAFLSRVKKEDAAYVSTLNTMTLKKIPCKYCKCLTITKYEDLTGHFIAFCPRCGQTATYTCPTKEINGELCFVFKKAWHPVAKYISEHAEELVQESGKVFSRPFRK